MQITQINERIEIVLVELSEHQVIIIAVIVYDMDLLTKSKNMLEELKEILSETFFDLKMFGSLKSLMGWEIFNKQEGILISQQIYTKEMLGMYRFGN